MDSVRILIVRFLVSVSAVLAICAAGDAAAAFPASSTTTYTCTAGDCGPSPYTVAGAMAACKAVFYPSNSTECLVYNQVRNGITYTRITSQGNPTGAWGELGNIITYTCPAGSTLSGQQCTCNSGLTEYQGQCLSGTCGPKAGKTAGTWSWTAPAGSGSLNYFICEATAASTVASPEGCTLTATSEFGYSEDDGVTFIRRGPGTYTGTSCNPYADGSGGTGTTPDGSESPTGDKPADPPCPAGQVPGQVNGATICVQPGPTTPTESKSQEKQTTTNPDGTTTESVTETTKTCDGVKCTETTTTTTTTKNSSGVVTGTSTTSTTKEKSATAGDGSGSESAFGGSCLAGFTCDGDAAQCAAARGVWEARCELKSSDEIKVVASQMAAGTFASDLPTTNVNLATGFNQTNPFSNSCPADIPISTGLVQISIPLSNYCSVLQALGNILVALTLLGATVFVIRGIN